MKPLHFSTSNSEVFQILKAWAAISLAFAIMLNRGAVFDAGFLPMLAVAAATVGVGFLLHELSHKIVALRYGCKAEFRSFDSMLLLAVAMSFLGFVFAAPGAVFIEGRINKARNGIISAFGPLTNMFLAIVFFLIAVAISSSFVHQIALYGAMINGWLGFFNLIPLMNLDGTKILAWSKPVYFLMAAFSFLLLIFSQIVV